MRRAEGGRLTAAPYVTSHELVEGHASASLRLEGLEDVLLPLCDLPRHISAPNESCSQRTTLFTVAGLTAALPPMALAPWGYGVHVRGR